MLIENLIRARRLSDFAPDSVESPFENVNVTVRAQSAHIHSYFLGASFHWESMSDRTPTEMKVVSERLSPVEIN